MDATPIVPHYAFRPTAGETARIERLAERLAHQHPRIEGDAAFRKLVPKELGAGPVLSLDDLTSIPLLGTGWDASCLEDRARLRAGDGDLVASCASPNPAYERYCEHRLGLGRVTWLQPRADGRRLAVAVACWRDRRVRAALIRAVRDGGLRYVHPHMGTSAVWAVASLLGRAARRDLAVVAPLPGVTEFVNDKLHFTDIVGRLFGMRVVPPTVEVDNFTSLARVVQHLAPRTRSIVVKIPESAGGLGNLVLRSRWLRGRHVGSVRQRLRRRLAALPWESGDRLLVSAWESDIVATPSAQLWIAPEQLGPPVVEGLFFQYLEGAEATFAGSVPALLPEPIEQEIVARCWMLGRLFQRIGYVGRCSFDMILVGPDLPRSRVEFIECNGRWGGTSIPMTLVNRLFGDWRRQPYAAHKCAARGLEHLEFEDLLDAFGDELFDARKRTGRLILFTPGRMEAMGSIDVIALGDTWDEADRRVRVDVPKRLAQVVRERGRSRHRRRMPARPRSPSRKALEA